MHELSIAQNVIEIIHQHVPADELDRVIAVRLKIGAIAGIVPDSLDFSFHAITTETPLCNARLEIELVPFKIQCKSCNTISSNEIGYSVCESCGSIKTTVISGTELQVSEIEIAETSKEIV